MLTASSISSIFEAERQIVWKFARAPRGKNAGTCLVPAFVAGILPATTSGSNSFDACGVKGLATMARVICHSKSHRGNAYSCVMIRASRARVRNRTLGYAGGTSLRSTKTK